MRIAAGILILAAGAPSCLASLEWKTTAVDLKTEVGQETAVVLFPFRNAGEKPVRINSLDPSCGCLAADPGKWVYAPGESGEIRVQMALTGYVGHLRRSVAVETDDPAHRFVELIMTVDIPEPVAIAPRFLFWGVGEQPEEKSLEIIVAEPAKTLLQGIDGASPAFTAVLETESTGRYRIKVKPAATQQPVDATIRLNAVIGGRAQVYIIYVAIK